MKKTELILGVSVAIVALAIFMFFTIFLNFQLRTEIPESPEVIIEMIENHNENYLAKEIIGQDAKELLEIWPEPDVKEEGKLTWNINNKKVIIFYEKDRKISNFEIR